MVTMTWRPPCDATVAHSALHASKRSLMETPSQTVAPRAGVGLFATQWSAAAIRLRPALSGSVLSVEGLAQIASIAEAGSGTLTFVMSWPQIVKGVPIFSVSASIPAWVTVVWLPKYPGVLQTSLITIASVVKHSVVAFV